MSRRLFVQAIVKVFLGIAVVCLLLLILGSLPAFFVMLPYPFLLVNRIINEEQLLKEGLAGYLEYTEKVRYRLIPFVW